jgi:hypothetical protein
LTALLLAVLTFRSFNFLLVGHSDVYELMFLTLYMHFTITGFFAEPIGVVCYLILASKCSCSSLVYSLPAQFFVDPISIDLHLKFTLAFRY